ncbi:protease SohB [Halioxenophilus aromaticivorans]|uniref:Protease SohB n=1 Tax=Halioxenophilus aromaticivorans TaxID=1306992 RepID=A0AAV3TXF5_9ALTE
MEFLFNYGLFLAKAVTFVIVVAIIVAIVAGISTRKKSGVKGQIEITDLNDSYQAMFEAIEGAIITHAEAKQQDKAKKKDAKKTAKQEKTQLKSGQKPPVKPRLFVLDFDGDIKASQVESLKQTISAVLSIATTEDEILLKLESGGGMVHSYGLAASQLDRIKQKGIPLTIAVDKIAASGGYMMACTANKILAAPFSIIGSIGVVAQVPNVHRLLKKHDVDVEILTAGEYKRTLTMLGENTEKGRAKFIEDLQLTHDLFKEFVSEHRPNLNVAEVATGEIWYGRQAIDKGLVDSICTSDQYITDQLNDKRIIGVDYVIKKNIVNRISDAAEASVDRLVVRWLTRLMPSRPQW